MPCAPDAIALYCAKRHQRNGRDPAKKGRRARFARTSHLSASAGPGLAGSGNYYSWSSCHFS